MVVCIVVSCASFDVYGQISNLTEKEPVSKADTSLSGKINALSPDQLLKGRISGIKVSETDGNPMGAITTTIRGINSMRGNSEPLWIVDGTILNPSNLEVEPMFWQDNYLGKDFTSVQNTLASINPGDIESIRILKDAGSTAIYGTKGGNGVIIITTRQAKQQERLISWSSNVSLTTSSLGQDMLRLDNYKNFQQHLRKNVSALTDPVNWTDEALKGRTAISHNHNISVSGTEKGVRYLLSGFYRQVEGVVERNNSTLGGARINLDMDANKLFSLGIRIAFAYADINMTKGVNPLGQLSTITSIKSGVPDLNALNTYASWQADYDDNSLEYRVIPSLYFTLKPAKGMKFSTNFGTDYRGKDRSSWLGSGIPLGFESNGAASLSSLNAFSYNVNSVLSYNKNFEGHNLSASAGAEVISRDNSFNTMNGTDFFSHELRAKGINLASSRAEIRKFYVKNQQDGFWGSVSYDYKGIYGVDGTLRVDKTRKQEDKLTFYPAIKGWWNLMEEDDLKEYDAFSVLKINVSWGKAGTNMLAPYEFLGRYYSGFTKVVSPDLYPFYKINWKTISNEFNAGIEIGILKDLLSFSINYYYRMTDDRITLNCFGEEFGNNGFWRYAPRKTALDELNQLSNQGIEFDFGARLINSGDWKWNLSINGASNINRVVKVTPGYVTGGLIGSGIYANLNQVGSPVSALFGYRAVGIVTPENISGAPKFKGMAPKVGDIFYKDLNSNGDITPADREIIGNPHPKFYGGLTSSLTHRRYSFEILIDGAYGHNILNLDKMMQENVSGSGNISVRAISNAYNFSKNPGYPSLNGAGVGEISSRYIESGDYTRLAMVRMEYSVPVQEIKCVKSLRISFNIYNALSNSSGGRWNPESNSYGFDNSRLGIAYGTYPESRFFTFGVNATF